MKTPKENKKIGIKKPRVGVASLTGIIEREKKKRKAVQDRYKQWKKDKKVAKDRAKKSN